MAEVLSQFSEALAGVVESAGKSIVRVEARRRMPATGIVYAADGLILTSHHGVQRDDKIQIGLPNGEKVSGKLVGRDPGTDLAVIRTESSGLTAATWADFNALRVGHLVLALGRPGDKVMATLGIVSAIESEWRSHGGGKIDAYLQTDVVMYPGFSGGPLVSASGEIIGMNTSGFSRGASLTIPSNTIKRVVDSLLQHGHVKRGYLGIGTQAVRIPANQVEALGQDIGLLVMSVEEGSPAEKGGLIVGDILVSVAGQPTRHVEELLSLLGGDRVNTAVPIKVLRGGQATEINVTVGERK